MSRVLSALALSLSLLSSAMAGDLSFDVFAPQPFGVFEQLPPAASLDWGVFDPMPVVGDAVTSDMFDVFSRGKTVVIQPSKTGSNMSSKDFESTSKGASKFEPYVLKPNGYPLRSTRWTGLPRDIPGAVHHLSTGHHAGQFDFAWLAGLTWDELDSLHADHHEGCVSTSARMAKPAITAPPKVTVSAPVQSACGWRWNGRQWVYQCR